MKLKIVLLLIFCFFTLHWKTNAAHYVLWSNSVINWEIKYNGSSKYDNLIASSVNTWNNYGDINIYQYYWTQQLNIDVSDVYDSTVTRAWKYTKKYWMPSLIKFNKWIFDWYSPVWTYSNSNKQKTITHEFWHALWLDHHNISWNVMMSWLSSQISLWTQDKSDYDFIW